MLHADAPTAMLASNDATPTAAAALSDAVTRLLRASPPASSIARIAFADRLDTTRPLLPATLLSLHGLPVFDALDDAQRWRLGLLETVNFFSMNIQGERALVAGLTARLDGTHGVLGSPVVRRFLQQLIDEENAHTGMLTEFCLRYHGALMPEMAPSFAPPVLSAEAQDLLLFARVFVLETLLDQVNRAAMHDPGLEPTARAVHRAHHADEARHIAFDRAVLPALVEAVTSPAERVEVADRVQAYARHAFGRLVNPRVYRTMGLPRPLDLAAEAAASPQRAALCAAWWPAPAVLLARLALLPPHPAGPLP